MTTTPTQWSPGWLQADYLRSVMFGLEDGLVSTTGAVVGIAAGSRDAEVTALAGVVLVVVESLSMAAGQLLSERAVHQLQGGHQDSVLVGAALMLASYAAAGLVPLLPVLAHRTLTAVWVGCGLAFPALLMVGVLRGRLVGVHPGRSGLEVLVVGGLAAAAGIAVGLLFPTPG